MLRSVAIVAVVLSFSNGAQAEFQTGNDLLKVCGDQSRYLGYCAGYIAAITDAVGSGIFGWKACIPAEATLEQIRDLTIAALRKDPSTRHLPASVLTASAIAVAWPCP